MRRYCNEIEKALHHVSFSDFNSNEQSFKDKRSACSLYLFQIGELANKLDDDFKSRYNDYSWRGAYKLRNIIGHDYEVISNQALWKASQQGISKLLPYVDEIINEVDKQLATTPKPTLEDYANALNEAAKTQSANHTLGRGTSPNHPRL